MFSTEPNNIYYGVTVTLDRVYWQPVTVSGDIISGDPDVPPVGFELTVSPGNLTQSTIPSYYQTTPGAYANAVITSVTPCPATGDLQFTMTPQLQTYLNQKQQEFNTAGNNMYAQVDALTSDVTPAGGGALNYPNYVRFVQIGDAIDELNHQWDDIYAAAMEDIVLMLLLQGQQ